MGRILALWLLLLGGRAWACASCGCGDPTLTGFGIERPYRNRLRVGLETRHGSLATQVGELRQSAFFLRNTFLASWSPHDRVTLGMRLPWLTSWIEQEGRRSLVNGLSDLELNVRALVYRDRRIMPRHLLSLLGGVKTPTGPRLGDGNGGYFPADEQPGSGSWDPYFGATYAGSDGMVSWLAAASYRVTTPGWRGYERGDELTFSAAVQVQPRSHWAFALGVDGNWAAADVLPSGVLAPSTGGAALYLAPALLVQASAWLVRLVVDVPMATALRGVQTPGTQVALSLAWDIR